MVNAPYASFVHFRFTRAPGQTEQQQKSVELSSSNNIEFH